LAHAAPDECDEGSSQFLLLSVSDRGDAVNCNCPGTYDLDGVVHPAGAEFEKTALQLGERATSAAALWSRLPQWALDRSSFIHHSSRSVVHSELPKILKLQGATDYDEMLPTLIAKCQAECLGTIQDLPVNLGQYVQLTAGGLALPRIKPMALKQLLASPDTPLADFRSLRDQKLDEMHALLKESGTPAQRAYLDARALSRQDARKLADNAASIFEAVQDDSAQSEVLAALALFQLRVSPVVTVSLPFGGDNHSDPDLSEEADQHEEGIDALSQMLSTLESTGMKDQVTFALLNVFGRNLAKEGTTGRDHWADHSVSLLVGKNVKGSVVGGLEAVGDDYRSLSFDSETGVAAGGGDIDSERALESVGKTIWRATGSNESTVDAGIEGGKSIGAALS
jgi:hypothetical protein